MMEIHFSHWSAFQSSESEVSGGQGGKPILSLWSSSWLACLLLWPELQCPGCHVGCGTSIFKFHCGRSQTFFLIFGVCSWLNNVVLVSGVQNSESVVCIHVSIPFQIIFQYVITKYWVAFSVLCSGSLLFIYFVSSRGYLSVPTLSRMPPLPHLPLREPKVWFWSLWVHFCPVSTFFGIVFH